MDEVIVLLYFLRSIVHLNYVVVAGMPRRGSRRR